MSEEKRIRFVDLVGQYHRYKDELQEAVASVLEKAAYIGGPFVQTFEANFAEYCGVQNAVGVGNGTDALYLTLRARGLGPGDEALVPANTFIATAEAVSMTGATPVFVDVNDSDALIDVEKAAAAVTDRTKAIIPVHLYGQLADMDAVNDLAKRHDLFVLEDAAQAHGAERDGKRAGAFGHAACFSFYPGKNLGAAGDAGCVVTNDDGLAQRVRKLSNHGRSKKYGHEMEGVNSRLDGLQAAILDVKLSHLQEWTERRQALAARYNDKLKDTEGVIVPEIKDLKAHVFHLYVIRVDGRDDLRTFLSERQIDSGVHYPIPLHQQPAYAHLGHKEGDFPVSEAWAPKIVSLPISGDLTDEDQDRVVHAVQAFVAAPKKQGVAS